jgi:hypothetical protein
MGYWVNQEPGDAITHNTAYNKTGYLFWPLLAKQNPGKTQHNAPPDDGSQF